MLIFIKFYRPFQNKKNIKMWFFSSWTAPYLHPVVVVFTFFSSTCKEITCTSHHYSEEKKMRQISEPSSSSRISLCLHIISFFLISRVFHYGVTFEWHRASCRCHVLRFPLISSINNNNNNNNDNNNDNTDYSAPFGLLLCGVRHGPWRGLRAISGSQQTQIHLPELLTFISPLSRQPSAVIDNTNTWDDA